MATAAGGAARILLIRLISCFSSSCSKFQQLLSIWRLCLSSQNIIIPTSTASGNTTTFTFAPEKRFSLCGSHSSLSSSARYFSSSIVHSSPTLLSDKNVVDILEERGLLESLTSDSLRQASVRYLRVYCGFDPTADSLHLGNLLGIIVLTWFLHCEHKAVALIGGATESSERPELDLETLQDNITGISATIQSILGRAAAARHDGFTNNSYSVSNISILNNYDWWKDVRLLDFLRDVGRFARVGLMMSKESVRKRLESKEQGMSFTEFTYQLLQGYDFVHLFRNEGVSVQIGGSDQWGNITAGTDLIRRILKVEEGAVYGLTFPLLLKNDGTKFGKSEDGAIWLSPSKLTPYNFYQYFFTVNDVHVVRFLKMLTFLSMEEIVQLERDVKMPSYVPNTAQRRLAEEVTCFVHVQEGLDEALLATETLSPGAATKLDATKIQRIGEGVPSCSLKYNEVLNLSLLDPSISTGLLKSKSAACRLLKQGGLYLNNSRVDNDVKKIEANDIIDGKVILFISWKKE